MFDSLRDFLFRLTGNDYFLPPLPPLPPRLERCIPDNPRYWCKCGAPLAGLYSPCGECGRDIMYMIRNGISESDSDSD